MKRTSYAQNQAFVAGGARSCAVLGHGRPEFGGVMPVIPNTWNATTKRLTRRLDPPTT